MIQAVLFDMDGLMFATEQVYTDCWYQAAAEMGITVTDDLLASLRGTGVDRCREIFNARVPGGYYDAAWTLTLQYVDRYIDTQPAPVKPGLMELLDWLKQRGIPMVLATSTARPRAMRLLRSAGVTEYFSAVTFGTEVPRPKPFPDIFLAAAKSVGAESENCVVLEDSHNGLRAAKAAGCTAIVVPDMDPAPDEALGLWDYQRESLDQVIPILESML